jgi:ribosome biogenesis protein BRX1
MLCACVWLTAWGRAGGVFWQILGTPKGHPKSKPFIDHVFSFSIADNKIWFRNHQITSVVASGSGDGAKYVT